MAGTYNNTLWFAYTLIVYYSRGVTVCMNDTYYKSREVILFLRRNPSSAVLNSYHI